MSYQAKWFHYIRRIVIRRGAIGLCFLLSACWMNTYQFNEGMIRFKKQDYRNAFVRLRPEAFNGIADAQYAVGFMYYYGYGVYENKKLAFYWIHKAAEQGHPLAIEALKQLKQEDCLDCGAS